MAASAIWKSHDTYPPLQAVLSDTNGAIVLSSATQVKVILKSTTTATQVLVTGVASVASAAGGFINYNWAVGDLAVADTYNVEFEIAWTTGTIETVPNDVYAQIKVTQDLEAA